MKLKGVSEYLSVSTFDPIELPQLTILVGLNGSGKSHFLQAIERGSIVTDLFVPPESQTWSQSPTETLRLENGGSAPANLDLSASSYLTQSQPRSMLMRHMVPGKAVLANFDSNRASLLEPALANLRNVIGGGLAKLDLSDMDVWGIEPEKLAQATDTGERLEDIKQVFAEAERCLTEMPLQKAHLQSVVTLITQVARQLDISVLSVTATHLDDLNSWGGFAAFDPNVAQVFAAYRDAHFRNDMLQVKDNRNGTKTALADKEFVERFGSPPWQLVSEMLKVFGLNYRVADPSEEPTEPVGFILQRLDTNVPVNFWSLIIRRAGSVALRALIAKLQPSASWGHAA